MPDPDLDRLQQRLARALALGRQCPDPHADGQAYYDQESAIADAQREAYHLQTRIAALDGAGRLERQKIGIARRQLGIPDDSHAERVHRLTKGRTRSTRDCTARERAAILAEYRALGFKDRAPKRAGRAPSASALDRDALLRKIQALLADQKLPWSYAEAILRRQRGLPAGTACPVDLVSPEQARGLIAALTNRARRQGRRAPEAT